MAEQELIDLEQIEDLGELERLRAAYVDAEQEAEVTAVDERIEALVEEWEVAAKRALKFTRLRLQTIFTYRILGNLRCGRDEVDWDAEVGAVIASDGNLNRKEAAKKLAFAVTRKKVWPAQNSFNNLDYVSAAETAYVILCRWQKTEAADTLDEVDRYITGLLSKPVRGKTRSTLRNCQTCLVEHRLTFEGADSDTPLEDQIDTFAQVAYEAREIRRQARDAMASLRQDHR